MAGHTDEDALAGALGKSGEGADGVKGESMPGIVSMDRNGLHGAAMARKDESTNKVNGQTPLPQLDAPPDMNGSHATNGAPSSSHSPSFDMSQPLPELPKLEECYLPFGKIVGRVAQETNNSLGDLLEKMSNLQINPAQALTNGFNGHLPNGDAPSPAASDSRKRLMLDWAWEEREKFVKLLVLSKWGRRADDVTRLIELNMWLNEQDRCYDDAATWIGHLKLNMQRAMDPSPDLKTALEVLGTGKVSAMPDVCSAIVFSHAQS